MSAKQNNVLQECRFYSEACKSFMKIMFCCIKSEKTYNNDDH